MFRKLKFGWVCLSVTVLIGCSVNKELVATGGSKADGTVDMSYDVGMLEDPKIDLVRAQQQAIQRCAAWGYKSAEPFGGEQRTCQAFNGYGNCLRWNAKVTYQCLGDLPKQ
jgi:YecR-like lipoprotein